MRVVARDGYPLGLPLTCDTLGVNPGERWDVVIRCEEPGAWAFAAPHPAARRGPRRDVRDGHRLAGPGGERSPIVLAGGPGCAGSGSTAFADDPADRPSRPSPCTRDRTPRRARSMRLGLTRRGDYAVRAMLALAARDSADPTNGREIASEMDPGRLRDPRHGRPGHAGLVLSTTGRAGGYALGRPPGAIDLLTVIEAVEGDSRRTSCVLRGGPRAATAIARSTTSSSQHRTRCSSAPRRELG